MKKALLLAVMATMTLSAADGAALFNKCAACHGAKGEKHALGKSKIINTMTPDDIVKALNGYKDGTYGGPMKAVMKGQAAPLSEEDIKAIADFIGAK